MYRTILLLAALVASVATASAQSNGSSNETYPDGMEVTLQPGDLIKIAIWREPDLSGEFPIDVNGMVTLPLLGDQQVSGVPVHQLRDALVAEYRVHLRNPSISITPLRRVNILGEVTKPGMYAVDPTISLAGAIALAGGANPQGDLRKIFVVRQGQVLRERVGPEAVINAIDLRSGDQIIVDRRSWLDRNSTFLVSSLLSVTSIIITIVTR